MMSGRLALRLGLLVLLLLVAVARERPRSGGVQADPAGVQGRGPSWPIGLAPPTVQRGHAGGRSLAHGGASPRGLASPFLPGAAGDPFTFALRDWNACALFTDRGIALSLRRGLRGWGLHWGIDGAAAVTPKAEGETTGRVNSYLGDRSRWKIEQPACSRVRYSEIRPGVDLVVESRRHGLEYRLHAAPGADLGSLRLRYAGAQEVRAVEDGAALEIVTGLGVLREEGLLAYQETSRGRRGVDARYGACGGDAYEIRLGPSDPALPLVIDPTLSWASFIGGTLPNGAANEYAREVVVDAGGNIFVTGETISTDFPTPGGFDASYAGSTDAFVARINAPGTGLAWASYLGGTGTDAGWGIAVDSGGDVYLTGHTRSTDFPSTPGAYDTSLNGTQDAFVAKVAGDGGALLWATYLGGSASETGRAVAVDVSGNVHVAGQTSSSNFPTPPGALDTNLSGADDSFVTRLLPDGSGLAWSTFLGGSSTEFSHGIAVDGAGNVYVSGETSSTDWPAAGGFQNALAGGSGTDVFVAKLNGSGSGLVWGSYLGGTGYETAFGMTIDGSANVYLTGYTQSTNFPVVNAFDPTPNGAADIFVTKVNAAGSSLAWSSYLGGSGSDFGAGVAVDGAGNVTVSGSTTSTDFPTSGGFDTTFGGGAGLYDVYIVKIDATGPGNPTLAWGSYLGDTGNDEGYGVSVDPLGFVTVTGFTSSSTFPTPGGFDTALGTQYDVFAARIADASSGSDSTPPGVTITSPTSGATWQEAANPLSLGGTATDNSVVRGVTWSNATTSASGTASGTGSWTASVPLALGPNDITVIAWDAAGNTATDSIIVVYDPTDPTISVTLPPSTATSSPVSLSGTAADNVGVTSVTWSNATNGQSGVATGTTSWTASVPLVPGTNSITIIAWDAAGNTSSTTFTITYTPPDTQAPMVTIDTPTASPTYGTPSTPLALGGTASDNVTVATVAWSNPATGQSGNATGTVSWTASVPLAPGQNVIAVTATDSAGNSGSDTITVTLTPPPDVTAPTVNITSPTSAPTTSTGATPIALGGTASDNAGISSVTWTNGATGGNGVASGTDSWTTSVPLASGSNLITVTAVDPSGNTATDTITVTFNPPAGDTIAPIVTVESPTTAPSFDTSASPVALAGSAADNVALNAVVWSNAATGQSGSTSGLSAWSASVPLAGGVNPITVTAYDTSGNTAVDTVTVNYIVAGGGGGGGRCGSLGLDALLLVLLFRLYRRPGTA